MTRPDVAEVIDIARKAGAELLALRSTVIDKAETKQDGSPVTEADKKSSEIVIAGLAALTPSIPVVSEENAPVQNRALQDANAIYWIVDPLDGTRSYIDGYEGFGVHIGLIENGQPTMGVVYFPAQGILYYTDGAGGAFRQEDGRPPEQIRVNDKIADGEAPRAAVSWVKHRLPGSLDIDFKPVPAVGGGRACAVAENAADLAIIEVPFSYWDIAAAHAILKAAGGDLFDLKSGAPVTYPQDRLYIFPAIGGHPDVVAEHREDFARALGRSAQKPNKPKPPGL